MSFTFDLISDLYATRANAMNFSYQQTSPHVLVAGNIASDRNVLLSVLTNLSKNYSQVFFIDGGLEHTGRWDNLAQSYTELDEIASMFSNVVFLQDRVVIAEGVAILGTNGWWDYSFFDEIDPLEAIEQHQDECGADRAEIDNVVVQAYQDAVYLRNSIERLQKHGDVRKIVLLTNSVPAPELMGTARSPETARLGNSLLADALQLDTEHKVASWCYGNSSAPAGIVSKHNVAFVSHPKQTKSGIPFSPLYYPRRVVL